MSRPLFTVVIPTIGRDSLPKTLASIPAAIENDLVEVIVVADAHGNNAYNLHKIEADARRFGARYLEVDAGYHDVGSPQLQAGYAAAEGQWILNCGDDDIYEPLFPELWIYRDRQSGYRWLMCPAPVDPPGRVE